MFIPPRVLTLGRMASAGLVTLATQMSARSALSTEEKRGGNVLRVAVIQMTVQEDKATNLKHCLELTEKAAETGAELIVLPEVWNSAYAVGAFRGNAEKVPGGESTALIQRVAKKHGVWVVGGSIPELGEFDAIYNTAPIVDPRGQVVAKHRKVHLFDIDVPGKIRFFESETLTAGKKATVVPFRGGHALGVGICYDMRFAELAVSMRGRGATVVVYPGAFNTVTGPPHYQLLARARALDAQAFVVAASPARNPDAGYQAFGNSIIVDPWGAPVVAAEGHHEEIIVADLDLDRVAEVRASMRLWAQRRSDVYDLGTDSSLPRDDTSF